MLVHQNGVVKISNEMPLDRALVGCGVTTGVGAVFRSAGLNQARPSRSLAVEGLEYLLFKVLI